MWRTSDSPGGRVAFSTAEVLLSALDRPIALCYEKHIGLPSAGRAGFVPPGSGLARKVWISTVRVSRLVVRGGGELARAPKLALIFPDPLLLRLAIRRRTGQHCV